MLHAGIAPGIDPGRIRVIRQVDPPVYEEIIDSLTPDEARALGHNLILFADSMDAFDG